MLLAVGAEALALEQHTGGVVIVRPSLFGVADHNGHRHIGGLARQLDEGQVNRPVKIGTQQQIFRRITTQTQFRRQ